MTATRIAHAGRIETGRVERMLAREPDAGPFRAALSGGAPHGGTDEFTSAMMPAGNSAPQPPLLCAIRRALRGVALASSGTTRMSDRSAGARAVL
jgi:hypothetical protein